MAMGRQRLCIATTLVAFAVGSAAQDAGSVIVTVMDGSAVQNLDDYYIGVNIDTGSVYNGLNFSDPLLVQLAANLAPAQARGWTPAVAEVLKKKSMCVLL